MLKFQAIQAAGKTCPRKRLLHMKQKLNIEISSDTDRGQDLPAKKIVAHETKIKY